MLLFCWPFQLVGGRAGLLKVDTLAAREEHTSEGLQQLEEACRRWALPTVC